MLIRKASDIRFSEVTPKSLYMRRREFIQAASVAAAGAAATLVSPLVGPASGQTVGPGKLPKLLNIKKSPLSISDKPTVYEQFTTYNNFYEFGTDKGEPSVYAKGFKTKPWTISVEGLVAKPGQFTFEEFIKPYPLEERIYRHRCVETWSAIVPWVGIPLADVVKRLQPTPQAKFIEFITLYDPNQMPGQRSPVLQWPYIEGLRLDEAMNPLALLAVGMYGEVMPNQDGAPIRLVVPWKYGFKGGKSLVKIRFVDQQPKTTWMISGPREYGFYANVNPMVDHPRWSQANDRPLGSFRGQKTLMFNGYADQVASLYTGMDLRKNF